MGVVTGGGSSKRLEEGGPPPTAGAKAVLLEGGITRRGSSFDDEAAEQFMAQEDANSWEFMWRRLILSEVGPCLPYSIALHLLYSKTADAEARQQGY